MILYIVEGEKPETKQKRLETKFAALHVVPNIDKFGTAKVCVWIFYKKKRCHIAGINHRFIT